MRLGTALSLAALLAGCKLTNDTVMVATLLESPAPPQGFPVAGSAVSVATVFLAQTDADLGSPPSQSSMTPITGATVRLVRNGIGVFPLAEVGAGSYEATGDFYVPNATFRFEAQVGSETFFGEVQGAPAAPAPTLSDQQQPGQQVLVYANYSAVPPTLTLHHCNGVCDIGIYAVWPVASNGTYDGTRTPSCHNLPSDAAGILGLAFLDDSAWRVPDFTLTKSPCFPALGGAGGYVVGLASVKKGLTSGNLAAFSTVMVGSSGAAAVVVNGP